MTESRCPLPVANNKSYAHTKEDCIWHHICKPALELTQHLPTRAVERDAPHMWVHSGRAHQTGLTHGTCVAPASNTQPKAPVRLTWMLTKHQHLHIGLDMRRQACAGKRETRTHGDDERIATPDAPRPSCTHTESPISSRTTNISRQRREI